MRKSWLFIFILFFPLTMGLFCQTADEFIQQGDALYARRGEAGMAGQALAKYQAALALAPENFAALIKNAQAMYYIGDNAASGNEKQKIFKQAMEICKKAVALDPGRVEGHYWLGVHTGSYGEARGVLKSLFLKNDIIRAMERAIAIDGAYEQGGAYCVLGRLYFKVPGLFGGSKKKSRVNLEKCLQLGPKSSVGRLFLAETYWALDEEELAVRTLEELLAMEPDPLWLPETAKDKEAGAKLLRQYKK